jgi:hypothetical protein
VSPFLRIAILCVVASVAVACASGPRDVRVAQSVVDDLQAGRFEKVQTRFDARMSAGLSTERLRTAWIQFLALKGGYRGQGNARYLRGSKFNVVNIILHMGRGDGQARVSFDPDGKIAGLYLLEPGVP